MFCCKQTCLLAILHKKSDSKICVTIVISFFVLLATFSLQGFTSDLIENTGSEIVLFVQCKIAQGSSTIGCLIFMDVYGSSFLSHTILKQEESDFAMGNISVPTTGSGGAIQLTAYSINKNGNINQNVLPLTQLISVPPISVSPNLMTSQLVLPTSSPSVIAIVTSSPTTSECLHGHGINVESTNEYSPSNYCWHRLCWHRHELDCLQKLVWSELTYWWINVIWIEKVITFLICSFL